MMRFRFNKILPNALILDLDGVLTDGVFVYGSQGKLFKHFSVDDHDGIRLVQKFVTVHVITADLLGFEIAKRRVEVDMKLPLSHVPAHNRFEWIEKHFDTSRTIYMGDGIFDNEVFKKVFYSIAPANALSSTRKAADFITKSRGGDRAVAEACLHIAKKFFSVKI